MKKYHITYNVKESDHWPEDFPWWMELMAEDAADAVTKLLRLEDGKVTKVIEFYEVEK